MAESTERPAAPHVDDLAGPAGPDVADQLNGAAQSGAGESVDTPGAVADPTAGAMLPGARKPHRSWRERAMLSVGSLGIVAALLSAGCLAQTRETSAKINRITDLGPVLGRDGDLPAGADLASTQDDQSGAKNFLLVGTDSSEGLDPNDPTTIGRDDLIARSDTMMILRLDADDDSAALLSIPRDLYVPIAGTGRRARINTALERGGENGRARLVQTIEEYFELDVDHYIEINFQGFQDLVDVLDGVPIYFKYPARDTKNTGLEVLDGEQCRVLDGEEALDYARTRSYQSFIDGEWVTDGSGDIGRIGRQQHFIRQAMRRASDATGRNPLQIRRLFSAGVETVSVDENIENGTLVDLALHFRDYDPAELPTLTLPVTSRFVGRQDVLELREGAAQPTLDIFRGYDKGEVSPRTTRVAVENGTGASGQASDVAAALSAEGFEVTRRGDANSFDHEVTVIAHDRNHRAAALLLATHIEGEVELFEAGSISGADVTLTTGTSFGGVLDAPVERPALEQTTTTTTQREGGSTTTTRATAPAPTVPDETEAEEAAKFGVVTELPDGVSC